MMEHIIIIPKEKREENDPEKYSLNKVLEINSIEDLSDYMFATKIENNSINFIDRNIFKDYYTSQNIDLSIKVAIMKDAEKIYYAPYLPFSFRQASFLYEKNISIKFIERHFLFTENELIDGYAIRREEENNGFSYYSPNTIELPEFISLEGIQRIKRKGYL